MISVDLFRSAGGMTLGAKLAGIKMAFTVEADDSFRNDIRKLRNILVEETGY
jgi:site-specific DNA-cytosine methylase